MRHDYDLPPDWDAMTDEEKSRWMTQERCRRQAQQQGIPSLRPASQLSDRIERILEARGYEAVKKNR
jgi:hypothetical protein